MSSKLTITANVEDAHDWNVSLRSLRHWEFSQSRTSTPIEGIPSDQRSADHESETFSESSGKTSSPSNNSKPQQKGNEQVFLKLKKYRTDCERMIKETKVSIETVRRLRNEIPIGGSKPSGLRLRSNKTLSGIEHRTIIEKQKNPRQAPSKRSSKEADVDSPSVDERTFSFSDSSRDSQEDALENTLKHSNKRRRALGQESAELNKLEECEKKMESLEVRKRIGVRGVRTTMSQKAIFEQWDKDDSTSILENSCSSSNISFASQEGEDDHSTRALNVYRRGPRSALQQRNHPQQPSECDETIIESEMSTDINALCDGTINDSLAQRRSEESEGSMSSTSCSSKSSRVEIVQERSFQPVEEQRRVLRQIKREQRTPEHDNEKKESLEQRRSDDTDNTSFVFDHALSTSDSNFTVLDDSQESSRKLPNVYRRGPRLLSKERKIPEQALACENSKPIQEMPEKEIVDPNKAKRPTDNPMPMDEQTPSSPENSSTCLEDAPTPTVIRVPEPRRVLRRRPQGPRILEQKTKCENMRDPQEAEVPKVEQPQSEDHNPQSSNVDEMPESHDDQANGSENNEDNDERLSRDCTKDASDYEKENIESPETSLSEEDLQHLLLRNSGSDCCFNSVVQSLRALRCLDSLKTSDVIWSNILRLRRSTGRDSIGTMRTDLGFDDQQHCAAEILQKCVEGLDPIDRSIFSYRQITLGRCTKCDHRNMLVENEVIMRLAESSIADATSVRDLLMNHTSRRENFDCNACGNATYEENNALDLTKNEVLVIQLPFGTHRGRAREIKLIDQTNSDVIFAGTSWKVMAGIVHYGKTMLRGHYAAFTHHGDDQWTLFDDAKAPITQKKNPLSSRGMYLIFLEKQHKENS